jgi:dipicolinate synthase subunit A
VLTGTRISVVGGDARQFEMIRMFCEADATVDVFGFDTFASRLFDLDVFQDSDAIVLPVAGMQGNGEVETPFGSQKLNLQAVQLRRANSSAVIFTGIANAVLYTWADQAKLPVIELLNQDDVAILNAIPTAEGAIMLAMQHTTFTLHDAQCVVLGYGRVGMTVARTLRGLGARVSVGVRSREQVARAFESSHHPFDLASLNKEIQRADIIFNTIPAPILDAEVLAHVQKHVLIIDLASRPGGTDFRYCDKRGIQAMLALGLPGKVAADTAGRILARAIIDLLQRRSRGEAFV